MASQDQQHRQDGDISHPVTSQQLIIDIRSAWQSRQISKCQSLLETLVARQATGLVRLALLLARRNNVSESLRAFEKCAGLNDYSSLQISDRLRSACSDDGIEIEEAILWWGYCLIRLERLDDAQLLADADAAAASESSLVQLLKTMVSFRRGNQDFALFQRAVDIRPSPEAFVRFIAHLVLSGKNADAVKVAHQAETTMDTIFVKNDWMASAHGGDRLLSEYLSSLPSEFLLFPELFCHAILKAIHNDTTEPYAPTLARAIEAAPIPAAIVSARFNAFVTDLQQQ